MATPIKVLIAEDSQDDVMLILAHLQREGFDPQWKCVTTEADFLAELKNNPDVILSDFAMPQFNGLRAAQIAKESGLNIPFILISGTVGEDVAVEAMKCGASDYLLKDRVARLGSAVERALEQKRLAQERQRTESELRWKTTLLEAQLDASIDGILVVDARGKKVIQNRRLGELWKFPSAIDAALEDSVQLAYATNQTKHPAQFLERVHYLYDHPEESGHDEVELLDGTVMDRYSAPIRDKAGKYYGRIWFFRDITERRKLELQIRQSQKMESIGQLAGGIAHDFNNILTAIIGNLYLARLEVVDHPVVLEHLDEMSRAAARATDLVNQILTFSRRNKPEREPVKLDHVVAEALKLLRASVPATINFQTELSRVPTVLANATAIHQVIMNLGTNAWHAMREQPGTFGVVLETIQADEVFIKLHPELHSGRYVRLSVSDTGCGMERAILERIFDPFFTTKSVGEGTGLGLAVVHGIVKSHDGAIFVHSQPGEGTKFDLYFPVFESSHGQRTNDLQPIPCGRGEHILVVDDEAVLATLTKKILERLGYRVTTKTSADDALAAVREQPGEFALVITDLTMPQMDGAHLGAEILRINPRLPIILTTGYSHAVTLQRAHEQGFREILNKPATARSLGEIVHRVLGASATE